MNGRLTSLLLPATIPKSGKAVFYTQIITVSFCRINSSIWAKKCHRAQLSSVFLKAVLRHCLLNCLPRCTSPFYFSVNLLNSHGLGALSQRPIQIPHLPLVNDLLPHKGCDIFSISSSYPSCRTGRCLAARSATFLFFHP